MQYDTLKTVTRTSDAKRCGKCKTVKALASFSRSIRAKSGLQSYCKLCSNSNRMDFYRNNRDHHRRYNQRRIAHIQETLNKLKSVPCADCGNQYPPIAMDFDHLRDKEFTISNGVGLLGLALSTILKEVDKCEVVCAVCHRIRTHNRRKALSTKG